MIGSVDPERDEFYVGYEPLMPSGIVRRVAAAVVCLAAAAAMAAIVAVMAQQTLPASRFEFGVVREFTGVLRRSPYPFLETTAGRLWLVAPGKFGAEHAIGAIADGPVRVSGSLIERGGHRMAEIAAIAAVDGPAPEDRPPHRGEAVVTLRGEIVDSKCYLGVMNPGEGGVHRDCSRRCLSGGIPPMLAVRDGRGREELIILVSARGGPAGRELAAMAGQSVELTGRIARDGDDYLLFIEAGSLWTRQP
jgi:hypothetical protein